MTWHGYLLVSELPPGWTNEQRLTAWGSLGGIGRQTGSNPATINHSRVRPDGMALIVEAEFDAAEITREAVVAVIAEALGVPPAAVDAKIEYTKFSSRAVCRDYLIVNAAEWDEGA